jgi:hypothetical protein
MAPRQRLAEAPPSAEEELLTAAPVVQGDSSKVLVWPPDEDRAKDQHDRFNILALVRWKQKKSAGRIETTPPLNHSLRALFSCLSLPPPGSIGISSRDDTMDATFI